MEGYKVSVPDAGGFASSRACFEALAAELAGPVAAGRTHEVLEEWLAAGSRELTRLLLQDHLRLRAVREVRRGDVTGAGESGPRRRVEVGHVRTVTTIFGQVAVERMAYRQLGATNLYPADALLNLPVGEHSHGLRKRAVLEAVRGSYDQAIAGIVRATGVSVGKGRMVALTEAAAIDITGFYQSRRPPAAPDGDVVVLTFDGKGVVMRPDGLRAATAKAAAEACTKLATRLSKGEKSNRKRLAEIGGVYDITPVARTATDIITEPGSTAVRVAGPVAAGKWLTVSIEDDAASVIGTCSTKPGGVTPPTVERGSPWSTGIVIRSDGSRLRPPVVVSPSRSSATSSMSWNMYGGRRGASSPKATPPSKPGWPDMPDGS